MERPYLGLALAPDGLRWASVRRRGRHARLVGAGFIPRDGEAGDADLIRSLRAKVGPASRSVRLLDDVCPAVLRIAALPPMPPAERALVLAHEAQAEVEILGGEVVHAGFPLAPEGGGDKVLLAILPRGRVEELAGALRASGFILDGICVGPVLLLDLLREMGLLEPAQSVAMIDVGPRRANLAVACNGELSSLRQVHQGVDSSFLGGTAQAEQLAVAVGGGAAEFPDIDQFDRGLFDLAELVGQIRRSLKHHEGRGEAGKVVHLWLAGEAARARSLAPLLQNDLKIPVELLDPRRWGIWDGEVALADEEAPSFALTLAAAAIEPKGVSLVIAREKRRRRPRHSLAAVGAAGLAMNVLLSAGLAAVQREARDLEKEIYARGRVLDRVQASGEKELAAWVQAQQAGLGASPAPGAIFDAIARALPDPARLERVEMEIRAGGGGPRVEMDGLIEGTNAASRQSALDQLVEALAGCGAFPAVRLAPLEAGTGPVTRGDPLRFSMLLAESAGAAEGAGNAAPEVEDTR